MQIKTNADNCKSVIQGYAELHKREIGIADGGILTNLRDLIQRINV